MIKTVFYKKNKNFYGFSLTGHAGYEDAGKDIVCSAVSSATMLTVNMLTDYFGINADVNVDNNRISIRLKNSCKESDKILKAFYDHIDMISQDYNGTISISVMEV